MTHTTQRTTGVLTDRLDLPQYSRRQILGIWGAVTIPMGVLAWFGTPWLSHRIGRRDPFISALMICFTVGGLYLLFST